EVDLHWVQRGGMAPMDMLEAYSGACKLIHVKDFRIAPLPMEVYERREEMSHQEFMAVFTGLAQFAEVGQGNMNWPALLPAAEKAGAEYFLIDRKSTRLNPSHVSTSYAVVCWLKKHLELSTADTAK